MAVLPQKCTARLALFWASLTHFSLQYISALSGVDVDGVGVDGAAIRMMKQQSEESLVDMSPRSDPRFE
jgi:hypothetical protein